MSNLAKSQSTDIAVFNDSQLQLLKKTILDDRTTNDELQLFALVCERTGLDPFLKQIYGIRYKGRLTFQTSIDGYRLIADRTGKYAGSEDPLFDEGLNLYQHLQTGRGNPLTATVTVWKVCQGVKGAFTASASWNQYAQQNPTWQRMPHLMLAKCAESLALRKAFPAELSGLRTQEEMSSVNEDEFSTPVNNVAPKIPDFNDPLEICKGWRSPQDAINWAKIQLPDVPEERLQSHFDEVEPIVVSSGLGKSKPSKAVAFINRIFELKEMPF